MKRKTPGPSRPADVHTLGDAQPGDMVEIESEKQTLYRVSWTTHGTTFVRRHDGGMRIGDLERRRSDVPCRLVDKQLSTGGYDAAELDRWTT